MVAINTSKKMESLKAEIELSIAGSQGTLEGIIRCVERLRQLIELNAPLPIIRREVEMIQYGEKLV